MSHRNVWQRVPYAYVAVETAMGTAADVLEAVTAVDDVAEAHVVAGEYDLILEVSPSPTGGLDYADSPVNRTMFAILTEEIRRIDGVLQTKTYIVID